MTFAKKMQRIAQKKWIFFGYLQKKRYLCTRIRKDAGVVDRAALEMRCTGNCTGGSNPSLSANDKKGKRLANKSLYKKKKRESRRRGMRTRRGFVIDEVAFETKWRKNPSLSANDKGKRLANKSLFFISPNVLPTNHTLLYICASFSSV